MQGVYAKNTLLRAATRLFDGEVQGSGAPKPQTHSGSSQRHLSRL